MTGLAAEIAQLLEQASAWEVLAVALGIAYLLLAMRESLWCWYAAFVSTLIYLFLFWHVGLLMESTLQLYYLAMAVYGWWHWRSGEAGSDAQLPITTWSPGRHTAAIVAVVSASLVSGYLLSEYTGARLPYLDSFTTWGSILTTWMVARKILENWIYWMVIDSVSLYLYLDRGLFLTALLFVTYLVIVVFGFIRWHRHYREQHTATPAAAAG